MEAHHHTRDVTFGEDSSASRTGSGPANLATIRAVIVAAIKDVGYLHVPEGRRDHTTLAEALPKPPAYTASTRAQTGNHGTRRIRANRRGNQIRAGRPPIVSRSSTLTMLAAVNLVSGLGLQFSNMNVPNEPGN